jgi:predicted transcriptional regulator
MPKRTGQRSRKYRSKIEVLRDFLTATQAGQKKTRIIGAANLNRRSFTRYADFCLERGLIVSRSGGYALTAQASQALKAIDEVLSVRNELSQALDSLGRATRASLASPAAPEALRPSMALPPWLSRSDFLDLALVRSGEPDTALPVDASSNSRAK